ncbi:hypothetical protein EVAR_54428_1 [Eumeta japonica]|uniref:Uncharacterized protein n=1 Tax=Eumeta variegata TaxID=151549 RepID=A0A4C1YVI0_EUMVA|nr:hypothetical protein EVAR_54428_1 [Eumeta japonica]
MDDPEGTVDTPAVISPVFNTRQFDLAFRICTLRSHHRICGLHTQDVIDPTNSLTKNTMTSACWPALSCDEDNLATVRR